MSLNNVKRYVSKADVAIIVSSTIIIGSMVPKSVGIETPIEVVFAAIGFLFGASLKKVNGI